MRPCAARRAPGRIARRPGRLLAALAVLAAVGLPSLAATAPAPERAGDPADSTRAGRPAPRPPSGLQCFDAPNDAGRAIELTWTPSPDDRPGDSLVTQYYVERSEIPAGPYTIVDSSGPGVRARTDHSVARGVEYFYRISAAGPGGTTPALSITGPVKATSEWINQTRWSVMVGTAIFFAFVLFYILSAQAGRKPFVRRIPGIAAIEEAVGRATEMGRPVLFVPGIQDIDEIQTVAGLVILENVARMAARYETPILVPVAYPIPFTIAQEMVRSGYLHAGRPEQYNPDSVSFVSPEQFAFVAKITGIMLRDKPAAHIFMGSFFAESLLLAETGFSTGAIQVAGTANVSQLPFFVVACDYTLIGEELYAASAYLSGEPKLVGALKGADLMKIVIIVAIVTGCVLETLGIHGLTRWMATQ